MRQVDEEQAERLVNTYSDLILLRSAHRQRTVGLELVAEPPAPEAPASYVLEAVMALPVKYRQVIYLYYYEGYSAREIGGLLGQSEASVNTYLSRGRSKLRALLKGDDYAHEIS